MIDPTKLRQFANEANAEKARIAKLELEEKQRQEQLKMEKEKAEAQAIIVQVERIIETAARDGKFSADIMTLDYKDYETRSYGSGGVSRGNLKLKARLVYDYLEDNNLKPNLDYDHDGMGMKSWYTLRANW